MSSSVGMVVLGQGVVVHGKDLHHDCLDQSFVQYLLFCVSGREVDSKIAKVFEELWIATAYPDVRIWCNRIAGYMGSARVPPALSMCAALSACNGTAYGFRAMAEAFCVQEQIPESTAARERWLSEQLTTRKVLAGYGRPIHDRDERVPVALKTLVDAGVRAGPALRRAFWLHKRLQQAKGICVNISAVWAAIAIDFGISKGHYEQFMLLMFAPGYAAAYADQRARRPLTFLRGHQTPLR